MVDPLHMLHPTTMSNMQSRYESDSDSEIDNPLSWSDLPKNGGDRSPPLQEFTLRDSRWATELPADFLTEKSPIEPSEVDAIAESDDIAESDVSSVG